MRSRGSLAVVLVLLAVVFVASEVSADGSSLWRLNNERNVPVTIFDIKNASSEQLSEAEHRLDTQSSLIYSDVDEDGFPEIYYCSSEARLIQYQTVDDSYHVLLEDEEATFLRTPQIVDVDHDDSLEILLLDGSTPSVRCFDLATGKEEWSISNPSAEDGISPMPKVWTDEGTNTTRVLVILYPGTLVMLDGQGKEVWRYRIEDMYDPPLYKTRPTMGIADLDLDGDLEAVVYSTKVDGDGLPFPDLDVFSLDPPQWLHSYSIPGNSTTGQMASSSPLLVDIIQLMDGLEIVVGTVGGGIAVVSSADGSIVWQEAYDDVWGWRSIGLVRTGNGTFITASHSKGIHVLTTYSGEIIHFHQMGVNTLVDIPLSAYCEPGSVSQALIYGAGHSVQAVDAEGGVSIWNDQYEGNAGRFRQLMIRGRSGVSVELHVFSVHSRTGGADPEVLHHRYWIPEAEDREIIVDPSHYIWYPNVSLFTRGILMDGAPKDIRWVLVRLYQGDSTDQFATNRWPSPFRKMESRGVYRLRVNRSSFGTDGIDNEHSWVALGIIAPWYYAQFGNIHLHVTVHYTDGKAISVDVRDWLRCERGLTVGGSLELVDGAGSVYHDGDWVRAGIDATLRGVHLTFPDGLHVPDPGDIRLTLTVKDTPYPSELGSDGEISATVRLPDGPSEEMLILLQIENLWTGFRTNHSMRVRLDADPPSFVSVFPENGTWLADVHISIGCLVTDGGGSGVAGVQVRHWSSDGDPGEWADVDTATRPSGTMAVERIHIREGAWSFQWRAWDLVGNGPVTSPVQTIHVDLTGVVFKDFAPGGWVNATPVKVSITVEDLGGSGVDLGSIEYAYSTVGLFNLTVWETAGLSGTEEEVEVRLTIPLEEGTGNMVMVRAADAVGNSRSSTVYTVRVDLTPPVFLEMLPGEDDVVMNETLVDGGIYVDDAYSGVDGVEYRFSIGADGWSEWRPAGSTGVGALCWSLMVTRNEGGPTSVQCRAWDRAGTGMAYSDVYVVNLNRPPEIVVLVPESGTEVREGEQITFSVEYLDVEGDDVAITWWLDGEEVAESEAFSTGLSAGEHEVRLVLDDGQGNKVEEMIDVSSVERTEVTVADDFPYLLVLLLVLIIVAVIMLSFRDRGR